MVPRPFHSDSAVSRRQLLASAGTFLAGASVVAAAGSQPASGEVSTTQLTIPDATYEGEDGSVVDISLSVSGEFQYETDNADTVVLTLEVAPENTDSPAYEAIDTSERSVAAESGAGQFSMSGSLLDHAQLDAAAFSAEPETTVTHRLPVRVHMAVRFDGEAVVEAISQTVARVEVTNTGVEASAAVVGEGEIAIEV